MTTLRPAPVPTRQLTWDPDTGRYHGEISSTYGFGRVFDDACDEGLTLVAKSGNEMVFYVDETVRDDEGDIRYWNLKPVTPHARVRGLTLFND